MRRVIWLGWLVLVLGGCGGSSQAPAEAGKPASDPCADVELDVEKIWSASIRAEFLGKGGAIAGETRQAVATKLDALSRDWVMLRRSVCLDHFKRQVITQQQYASRAACLDQNLQRQRSLIAALDAGGQVELDSELKSVSDEIGQCGTQ
jgi:hypothetical protein